MSKFQRAESNINPLDLFSAFIQPEPGAESVDRSARYMPRNIAAEGGAPQVPIPPETEAAQPSHEALSSEQPPPPIPALVSAFDLINLVTGEAILDGREVTLSLTALNNIKGIVAIAIADRLAAEAQEVINKHAPPKKRK